MGRLLRWGEGIGSAFLLVWFFVPVAVGPLSGGTHPVLTGLALAELLGARGGLNAVLPWVVWVLPGFVAFRLGSLFLPDRLSSLTDPLGWAASTGRFFSSIVLAYATLVPFALWGNSPAWFAAVPPTTWLMILVAAFFNISAVAGFVHRINYRNPVYAQYRSFVREGSVRTGTRTEARPMANALAQLRKIRSKLLLSFMGIITVILVVLSTILLSNYEKTILKAVGDGARAQVDQATSVYKANLGGATPAEESRAAIAMFDFLNAQARVNASAAFPFRSFVFYTDLKSRYRLNQKDPSAVPSLRVEYSSQFKDTRFPEAPRLSEADLEAYLTPQAGQGIHDEADRTYSFAAPILKNDFEKAADGTKVKHDLLLGLAVVVYDEDVILAPYLQTRTDVLVLTLLFLYFGVALVYIVGNYIVNPLLFLRMNVRTVSDSLQTMIRGEGRVSAANLRFDPNVTSHDEVHSLSGEIGDMVTVIKGIIPYISASTLKQAEKGTVLSQSKNLAFLFTDIRGFTSLCEGMKPEEVVTLLNRYLDLETEIILSNHGDVDKFVGDEMMASFDGPDKERNACRAAMEIREAMYQERARRLQQGLPTVEIGIGINTGEVVFGSVGARDRMDFTSIGDTVNLAARLEGANKVYQSKSLVSEAVYHRVKDQFLCRELDFITVKGKADPVRIYEILQESKAASPKLFQISRSFEAALASYRAQDWAAARSQFQALVDQFADGPSAFYLERVARFEVTPPPADWDGVYRMENK